MIRIDGSAGEGGGQVLRTALGLSLVTGRSFQIDNIRAKRKKTGLMRQHLTAVRAAAEIGSAVVTGDEIGSGSLQFTPTIVHPGDYHFSIGTAGSCTLVFQAVLPALLVAGDPSKIVLEGGTHNPMAPPFDFLERTFLPMLEKMGVGIDAVLERPGFFPAGGGRMRIEVRPVRKLKAIELVEANDVSFHAVAVCAQLPSHIGQRELRVVRDKLGLSDDALELITLEKQGPGNMVSIFARSEQLTETFTGFGEKNVKAEKVALKAVKQARDYLETGAPVGPYLADQLVVPMALAGSGRFLTCKPTEHTLTNINVIGKFLECKINLEQVGEKIWEISIS
jgi:RNA 3'-terminal phosphate cyclase (ATP)